MKNILILAFVIFAVSAEIINYETIGAIAGDHTLNTSCANAHLLNSTL